MLTMKAQYSLKNAESYFQEHLRVGDYYMEGLGVSGEWFGGSTSDAPIRTAFAELSNGKYLIG